MCNGMDAPQHAPRHRCYHAEFGRCTSRTGVSKNGDALEPRPLGMISWNDDSTLKHAHPAPFMSPRRTCLSMTKAVGINKENPKNWGALARPLGMGAWRTPTTRPSPYVLPRRIWSLYLKGCGRNFVPQNWCALGPCPLIRVRVWPLADTPQLPCWIWSLLAKQYELHTYRDPPELLGASRPVFQAHWMLSELTRNDLVLWLPINFP